LAAGIRRLRYASAPANIHRASGAEEFASKIWKRAYPGLSALIAIDFYLRGLQMSEVNMESLKTRLMREAVICSIYFVISLLSAMWACHNYIAARDVEIFAGLEVEPMGTFRRMQSDYLVPFICVFAILCALRFLSIVLFWYGKRRAVFSNRSQ
jgi:hypothetical protein